MKARSTLSQQQGLCLAFSTLLVLVLLLTGLTLHYSPTVRYQADQKTIALTPLSENQWRQSTEQGSWEPRKVLLLTYTRSGSSFTGDVISHNPDVYYVFEPLRQLYWRNVSREAKEEMSDTILQGLFSCNFSEPLLDNIDRDFLSRNNQTKTLKQCLDMGRNSSKFQSCVKNAEAVCQDHGRVTVKVVRYPLASAKQLMTLNPDLALLYLVRDPRGSFWSRITVLKHPTPAELSSYSNNTCQRMVNDLAVIRSLFHEMPHRVSLLRYEDLARNPLQVSRNMYKFLRLSWNADIESAIVKQTQARVYNRTGSWRLSRRKGRQPTQAPYGVIRSDSFRAANSWRKRIPWKVSSTVEAACKELMDTLGYASFRTRQDLRNLTLSSMDRFSFLPKLNTSVHANLGDVAKL